MNSNGGLAIDRFDGLATIILRRATTLNALDHGLLSDLRDALADVSNDRSSRALMITGMGRGFCAGQDLREVRETITRVGRFDLGELLRRDFHPLLVGIRALPIPVVAAVNGVAAGAGLALACVCDVRVASASATFHPAWSRVALAPDFGAGYLLPRLIGHGRAFDLFASARPIGAEEAREIGLVTRVWPDATFEEAARAYGRELAAAPTFALAMTKMQLNASWENDLEAFLVIEAQTQAEASMTKDHREGIDSFFERRPARFEGH